MQLKKVLYGDAMLVDQRGPPIWRPVINENIWSSFRDQSACFSLINEGKHFFSKRHRLKHGLDSGIWTLLWTLCKKDSNFDIFNSKQVSLA